MKVIKVEPLPDKKGISTSPTIEIRFARSIKGKKISVAASPKTAFKQSLSSGGFRLSLTPKKALKPKTKYTLSVLSEKKKIYSWSFTTGA
ncbi:MAG: hypothetical protein GTO45_38555, partial [Candidatus Aminicenantes bacterium]|nr:hypothetical protein [Candidatus Aminicenantes bacterium]NIN24046.1 hypothetical protein [Candidatus Aminicenantes bacterium]NIN47752.1 hypothetical protein [Candidatus Aminicenantes bacterium]NIN90690.1 hypothetical protein [Candidatus Aminicenantes bacterium]NIO87358.1 hypothetical protein [Candidatus Aminicenantes bacterium]